MRHAAFGSRTYASALGTKSLHIYTCCFPPAHCWKNPPRRRMSGHECIMLRHNLPE